MDLSVDLCMGCMNELDADGTCHYCSYTDDIPHLQSYLAPKTVLDNRYIVGKMLSYNGEGASYICYDTVGKCKCVCREYMPDTLCERNGGDNTIVVNPDCLAKYKTFMSEFADMNKVLSRMRNLTHITTVKDMFSENNTTYVILEYVEGVSLKKFLQSNTGFLTWEQVRKLFVPLFTTLSIIHNAGMIHRGISPENILVTTEGELKLTGFCISSVRTSDTGLMPEFYSGYTAPEQYSSLQWQGTWTDVYAVAAVLYRILTGSMPLDAKTRNYNDTMVEASRINPRIPVNISKAIAHAMAVRGQERIQTIDELVTALFEPRNTQLEHSKGATQTIPIQHVAKSKAPKKKPQPEENEKKFGTNMIVGWCVLAGVLTLVIVMMLQFFTTKDDDEDASSFEKMDGYNYDQPEDEDNTDSDEYVYSMITTTTAAPDNSGSEWGYGSIMPNLVGMMYSEVDKKIGGEFVLKADYYFSEVDERGYVRGQSIPENSDYDPKAKNELVLEVCAGPASIPVPSYAGYTKKEYLTLLDQLMIKYKVENQKSATVEVDGIISTSIAVGEMINVEKGEELTVVVCNGKITTTTKATTTQASQSETQPAATETQPTVTETEAPVTKAPVDTEPAAEE